MEAKNAFTSKQFSKKQKCGIANKCKEVPSKRASLEPRPVLSSSRNKQSKKKCFHYGKRGHWRNKC